jgi:FMN phosphatase YigB (HAD superfamily)
MALTLEEYAAYLDRSDLAWPAPPPVKRPKAKAHLVRLPDIRAVTWNVYGTLLSLAGGELYFEHPDKFVMDVALDKTIQEYKMWASMSRRPGQPTEHLREVYGLQLAEQRMAPFGGEKYVEVLADRLWETFIKKLLQKDYKFDAGKYGSLNEFSRKVAYFFHASLQGTACYPGTAEALGHVKESGRLQGIIGNTQCFTMVQLARGLSRQDPRAKVDELIDTDVSAFSHEVRLRQPSEKLYRHALTALSKRGISPDQVLHIGPRILLDIVPARRLGMKTGLFAGDKASLQVTAEQLKEPTSRPDVLLTELTQIADVLG